MKYLAIILALLFLTGCAAVVGAARKPARSWLTLVIPIS